MEPSLEDQAWLARALDLACASARDGGGPFGAVVARNGELLGEGTNRVTLDLDPTAHAEVVALRAACAAAKSHALPGAVLYTSCEPCPMCLAAASWARVARVVHCATRRHAGAAGFDDELLYRELSAPVTERRLPLSAGLSERAEEPFRAWLSNERRVPY